MATSIVKVYNNTSGKWARGVRVVLHLDNALGGRTHPVNTDESGSAIIDHSTMGNATVFLDGKESGMMRTPGSGVFYIN